MMLHVLLVVVVTCCLWGVRVASPAFGRQEGETWPHPQVMARAAASHWDYGPGSNGPAHWDDLGYPYCGQSSQSPIDVVRGSAIRNSSLSAFQFDGHYSAGYDALTFNVTNTGHSLKLYFVGAPAFSLSGGGMADTWALEQLHLHWGTADTQGSEHTIDGDRFPAEMHLVHYNTAYSNFSSALSYTDGLVVLSFMLEVDDLAPNTQLTAFIDAAADVQYAGDMTSISPFSVRSMLPLGEDLHGYYRYTGSLTTPPCTEVVTWSLYSQARLYLTTAQMATLRSSLSEFEAGQTVKHIGDNYRPLQALNGRKVQLSGGSVSMATLPLVFLSSVAALYRI